MSTTIKVECPRCKSDDCNRTYEELGELIRLPIVKATVFCNSCTFTRVSLLANRKEICIETKEPQDGDTEVEYRYLGKLPG